MAFTEFYCVPGTGANINAGSTTGAAVSTTTNGNWDATTGVFIAASGTPFSGTSVGDWASVYNDGATTAVYVGRVTAVTSSTQITVSLTAKSGTAPTTSATGRSVTIGGSWAGPSGAAAFPFGFVEAAMTNSAGDMPRVNFKNNSTYSITAAMTHGNSGPARFQGYSSTVGDGGLAKIDGGASGASYTLLNFSAGMNQLFDFELTRNGATGTAAGLTGITTNIFRRVVVHDVRGAGFNFTSSPVMCIECEAYNCNQGSAANTGAFHFSAGGTAIQIVRCISHDNTTGTTDGFRFSSSNAGLVHMIGCIADTNSGKGAIITLTTGSRALIHQSDFYNNTSDGLTLDVTTATTGSVVANIENSNFVKNGGYGIHGTSSGRKLGQVQNCGFGGGASANTSGTTATLDQMEVLGSVTYTTHPWNDPANGDFRIVDASAKGAGRGTFTETASSYSGTVAYPDIGAAQHQELGGQYIPIVRRQRVQLPPVILRRQSRFIPIQQTTYVPLPQRYKTRIVEVYRKRPGHVIPATIQNVLLHSIRKVR